MERFRNLEMSKLKLKNLEKKKDIGNDLWSVRVYLYFKWSFDIHIMFEPLSFILMQMIKQYQ